MSGVPDITDSERWVVEATLKERYGKARGANDQYGVPAEGPTTPGR